MQFFSKLNINFIGQRKYGYIISTTLIVIGLIFLVLRGGPNYGVDFRGGVSIRVQFPEDITLENVRNSLNNIGLGKSELKESRKEEDGVILEEFIIRVPVIPETGGVGDFVIAHFKSEFGEGKVNVQSIDEVGPKVGKELRRSAIYAIIISLVVILFYIRIRFKNFRFAVGAIIPLFHDVLITLGVFSILNIEISLPIVAAFLTIVGYSLNDTIVVFDRIRENLKTLRKEKYDHIINVSINETLSRTIVTSITTLFVVLILFFFGGDVIHNFAFALIIGIIIGTYSSIFVASPILIEWENRIAKQETRTSIRGKKR